MGNSPNGQPFLISFFCDPPASTTATPACAVPGAHEFLMGSHPLHGGLPSQSGSNSNYQASCIDFCPDDFPSGEYYFYDALSQVCEQCVDRDGALKQKVESYLNNIAP